MLTVFENPQVNRIVPEVTFADYFKDLRPDSRMQLFILPHLFRAEDNDGSLSFHISPVALSVMFNLGGEHLAMIDIFSVANFFQNTKGQEDDPDLGIIKGNDNLVMSSRQGDAKR